MKVSIINLPSRRIACLRHIGPYGPSLGTFWRETFWPWVKANGLEGRTCYGIGHDDPSNTAPDKCRYDAGIEVSEDFVPNGSVNLMQLPGGRYAVSHFKGNPVTIGDAWVALFRDWLPQSGLQVDPRPCFEYYAPNVRTDAATGVFECDLCVPVRAA